MSLANSDQPGMLGSSRDTVVLSTCRGRRIGNKGAKRSQWETCWCETCTLHAHCAVSACVLCWPMLQFAAGNCAQLACTHCAWCQLRGASSLTPPTIHQHATCTLTSTPIGLVSFRADRILLAEPVCQQMLGVWLVQTQTHGCIRGRHTAHTCRSHDLLSAQYWPAAHLHPSWTMSPVHPPCSPPPNLPQT